MFLYKWILPNNINSKLRKKFNPLIGKKLMSQNGNVVMHVYIFYSSDDQSQVDIHLL